MTGYNKVILIGNLTRDPQVSYLPSQTAVAEFGMAMNRKWTDQSGQTREDVCFVDCRAYGKQAETLQKYVKKGSPLFVEGRLQFDTWEGKDGTKRSKHRVWVERFQFIGGGQGGGQGYQGQSQGQGYQGGGAPRAAAPQRPAPAPAPAPAEMPAEDFSEPPPPDINEAGGETIPF